MNKIHHDNQQYRMHTISMSADWVMLRAIDCKLGRIKYAPTLQLLDNSQMNLSKAYLLQKERESIASRTLCAQR